jgi:rhodanese-related sulfurtransferase
MKKIVALLALSMTIVLAGQYDKVKITPDIAYIYVYHKGKAVKVHRIQNTKHKLTGEYALQYRPGKDIQPIKMDSNVRTIGEVELIDFMTKKVNKKRGVLIDVRSKKAYKKESIPSAVNIPLRVIHNHAKFSKILQIFGAKKEADGTLNTDDVLDLAVYCHGLWCSKSSEFIRGLLNAGYPAKHILYYRGGFQMWKILGFTTVQNN